MSNRDNIYAEPQHRIEEFVFDDRVATVFEDMVGRSVPGYATTLSTVGELAAHHVPKGAYCYDLGCSLGAATLAMRRNLPKGEHRIIAVDNSSAMIERGKEILAADISSDTNDTAEVDMICADIRDVHIENAALVVLNFTLQFLPLSDRLHLLERIYRGMLPGGKLLLSEKICFSDQELNALNIELHHRFKQTNGYSELEISQKRSALENRLIPETIDTHKERLASTGFARADVWYQCFNFVSMIAVKSATADD